MHGKVSDDGYYKNGRIIHGKKYGNMIILVFGNSPKTAALAHMDEVGFMTGHNNKLFRLGKSKEKNRDKLYGYVNNKRITATIIKKPRKLYYNSKCSRFDSKYI